MTNPNIIRIIQCDICNRQIPDIGLNAASPLYERIISNSLCPECAFWNYIVNNKTENLIRVFRKCYRVLPFQPSPPPGAILGNNGKRMYFLTTSGAPIMSNDVWFVGTVPERFAHHLPDNAYRINLKAYNRLLKREGKCRDYQCPDRYRCFFYNWKEESTYTPIPQDHIPGTTECNDFLPLRWIENFDYTK